MTAVVGRRSSQMDDFYSQTVDGVSANCAKRRKVAFDLNGYNIDDYNDGNIMRLKLKNFVTYSRTEFTLSPTLNMIIGPNGTGKSTFVCALCLGLGGKPEVLGRQKHASEFIKEGENFSVIETELKYSHDGKKTVSVRREMTRNPKNKTKEKSEWFVDDIRKDEKYIKKLLQQLNIQLNNLCCFLPQDKVSSFAALKPEALLLETERAAGDGELLTAHEQLIAADEVRISLLKEIQRHETKLTELLASRDRLRAEAEKFLKFKEKKDELLYHEKLLPYAIVQDRKKKAAKYKERRNYLQKQYQFFCKNANPLDKEIARIEKSIEKKEQQIKTLKDSNIDLKNEYNTLSKKKATIDSHIDRYNQEKVRLEGRSERKHQEFMKVLESIKQDKAELESMELPDDSTIEKTAVRRNELRNEKSNLSPQISEMKESEQSALNRISNIKKEASDLKHQATNSDPINNYNRYRGNKQFEISKQAVLKLRLHPELKGKVFEPPLLSISVTDERYAKYLELLVDNNTKAALTAKSKEVYNEVSKTYFKELNVAFRYPGEQSGKRQFTDAEIREYGFDGYLIDFVKGPAEVKNMLYDNLLYDLPVSLNELNPSQMKKIMSLDSNGKPLLKKFAVGDTMYTLSTSNYGSRQVISRALNIRPAGKNSSFGAGKSVDTEAQERIKDLKHQFNEEVADLEDLRRKIQELTDQINKINSDFDFYSSEHNRLVKRKSTYKMLQSRIARKEEQANDLKADAERDVTSALSKLESKITAAIVERLAAIEELVQPVVEINKASMEIAKLEFEKLELFNKKVSMEKMTSKLNAFKQRFKEEIEAATARYNEVRKSDEIQRLKEQTSTYSEELREILGELAAKYQGEERLTEIHIRGVIAAIRSEIGGLEDASSSSIEKLETIESQLNDLNQLMPSLKAQFDEKQNTIDNIRGPWEAKLDTLVNSISTTFSKKFVAVASAGEVRLNKEGGFKSWRLELLVKFRDESSLRVLDPFIQSGGERAVTTIFFMLSLQGLTNSPFRVVDEINQGMDPKNESIVHRYMVESACQSDENGAFSQYFLITPKLLTNLFYHEKMAVHCIMANHKLSKDVWS